MKIKTPLSIDIEGPDARTYEGDITVIGISPEPKKAIALMPEDPLAREALKTDEIIGANYLLYDAWVLYNRGYSKPNKIWDIRQAGKVLNPDTPNDLFFQSSEFAMPPMRGYWKTKKDYRDNEALVCMNDVDATYRTYLGQKEELERKGQLHLMTDYLQPLSNVLLDMRIGGMKIDRSKLEKVGSDAKVELAELRAELPDWGGTRTEGQHIKVHNWLYNELKLPVQYHKDDRTKVTADEQAIETLISYIETGHKKVSHLGGSDAEAAESSLRLIQTLRDKGKLYSSFYKRYLTNKEEYIHGELNPVGTATLRLSGKNPNLLQVDKRARVMFVPDYPDWEIMSVDLKQAEAVGLLWFCEEWKILDKVLNEGVDTYGYAAGLFYGTDIPKSDPRRDLWKTTTLACIYGETVKTLAKRLQLSESEAKDIQNGVYKTFPGLKSYREQQMQSSYQKGYVEDPYGLRRFIRVRSTTSQGRAANQACNAPIQGIPPKKLGSAMIKIHKQLPKPARMLVQVYDEIVLTYPKALRHQVKDCVISNLRTPVKQMPAPQIGMPEGLVFGVDCEVGENWGEMHEI